MILSSGIMALIISSGIASILDISWEVLKPSKMLRKGTLDLRVATCAINAKSWASSFVTVFVCYLVVPWVSFELAGGKQASLVQQREKKSVFLYLKSLPLRPASSPRSPRCAAGTPSPRVSRKGTTHSEVSKKKENMRLFFSNELYRNKDNFSFLTFILLKEKKIFI